MSVRTPGSLAVRMLGALLLAAAGCAEPGLSGGAGGFGASSPPSGDLASLRENLQGLRRGLANQEERIESSRRALQGLRDRLEQSRGGLESGLQKVTRQLEELRGRLEAVEGELALLRSSGSGGGRREKAAAGPAGAPSEAEAAGVPTSGSPVAPQPLPVGIPGTGETAPVGVPAGEAGVAVLPKAPAESSPRTAPQPPAARAPDPEEEYIEALRVLRDERSLPRARSLLTRFIVQHPTHELADDAQYWIGQSYFEEKNYERAILAFNKVQVDYANGDKAPDALLYEALSFLNLGDRASARELLGRLVVKFPGSEAARVAAERLKNL